MFVISDRSGEVCPNRILHAYPSPSSIVRCFVAEMHIYLSIFYLYSKLALPKKGKPTFIAFTVFSPFLPISPTTASQEPEAELEVAPQAKCNTGGRGPWLSLLAFYLSSSSNAEGDFHVGRIVHKYILSGDVCYLWCVRIPSRKFT